MSLSTPVNTPPQTAESVRSNANITVKKTAIIIQVCGNKRLATCIIFDNINASISMGLFLDKNQNGCDIKSVLPSEDYFNADEDGPKVDLLKWLRNKVWARTKYVESYLRNTLGYNHKNGNTNIFKIYLKKLYADLPLKYGFVLKFDSNLNHIVISPKCRLFKWVTDSLDFFVMMKPEKNKHPRNIRKNLLGAVCKIDILKNIIDTLRAQALPASKVNKLLEAALIRMELHNTPAIAEYDVGSDYEAKANNGSDDEAEYEVYEEAEYEVYDEAEDEAKVNDEAEDEAKVNDEAEDEVYDEAEDEAKVNDEAEDEAKVNEECGHCDIL